MVLAFLAAFLTAFGNFTSTASASTLLDNLLPGHWVEVPNSRLDAVAPNPLPLGNTTTSTSPVGIVAAESGAAFDTNRNRFMIWGGGHGDYSGNEIYAFDVDTLSWERIEDNTPVAQIPGFYDPTTETYPDGKPASRHTYDGLVYLPDQDVLWEQGGSRWSNGSAATWATWQYDLNSSQWERKADADNGYASTFGINAQYDPVSKKVIWRDSFDGNSPFIKEYDPVTDVWTKTADIATTGSSSTSSALDPGRRIVIFIGTANYGTSEFFTYNIDTHQYLDLSYVTTGDIEIQDARAPGAAYSSVADTIVAWEGGSDVYTLDLDALTWTKVDADPTNTVIPNAATNTGTFGRWQYVPSEDVFMVYNDTRENVFFYRLPSLGQDGDFDGDGDVDGSDFLTWQRDPGVGDLALWQSNYGAGTLSAVSSVPEPSSIALLLAGLTLMARRRG